MISKDLSEAFKHIGIDENGVNGCTIHDASIAYRRTAKIVHPDRLGSEATQDDIARATAAFQTLGNAYKVVVKYLVDKLKDTKEEVIADVEKFSKDNFESFNFPTQNKGSFTVEIENRLADTWQECLEKKFGPPKVFINDNGTECDRTWKYMFGGQDDKKIELTIHIYNKPQKKKKSKILVQGSDNSIICLFVFGELPQIYKMVCSMQPKPLDSGRKLRNSTAKNLVACEECDFRTSYVDMRMHMKSRHNKNKKARLSLKSVTSLIGERITRDEKLLDEDLSFSNLPDDISRETEEPIQAQPIQCDWLDSRNNKECEYKSTDKGKLMGHISYHLKPNDTSQKTSGFVGVENIFSCERCDYDTECEGQLKKHYEANIHSDVMSHAESNGMSHNLEEDNSDVEVVEEAIDHSINLVEDIPHEKPHEKVHQETQIIDDSNATDRLEQVNGDDKVQQNQPNQMTFICGECATSFEDETTINMHIETHGSSRNIQTRSVPTFKCDQCDHIYLKNEELKKHKVNVHKMYGCIYVCNGCDYKTSQITTFWAHKLKVHGDGPMQENNVSYGNLFLNVLASQQENMNDEIKKQKSEHNIEFQNIKKVHDILLNNIEVLTHKMNYVIANSDQIRSDNRSIYQTNLEKFKVMGVGMKAINDKIDNLQVKQNETNFNQPTGRPEPLVIQPSGRPNPPPQSGPNKVLEIFSLLVHPSPTN